MTGSAATLSGRTPREGDDVQQIRNRLLRAALDMVAAEGGLGADLHGVGFDAVIRRAGVPRTSAYRIWPNREEFHCELVRSIAEALSRDAVAILAARREVLGATVAAGLGELTTPPRRQALHRRLVRASVRRLHASLVASPALRTYLSATAYAASPGSGALRAPLAQVISDGQQAWVEQAARDNADLAELFGYRLRPPMTYPHLVRMLGGCIVGLAVQDLTHPDGDGTPALPGPDGGSDPWTPVEMICTAVFDAWVVFDQEYDREGAVQAFLLRMAEQESAGFRRGPS